MTTLRPYAGRVGIEIPKEERLAWVEAKISAKLSQGPATFQVLSHAIGVRRQTLGYALNRLRKSGSVVVKEMAVTKTQSGPRAYPVYALAADAGTGQAPDQTPWLAESDHFVPIEDIRLPKDACAACGNSIVSGFCVACDQPLEVLRW